MIGVEEIQAGTGFGPAQGNSGPTDGYSLPKSRLHAAPARLPPLFASTPMEVCQGGVAVFVLELERLEKY